MKRLALPFALAALVGCGGASPPAKTAETTPEATSTGATSTTSAKSEATKAPARDPKIMQLATAATACKWEDDHFVDEDECAAYKAWKDEDDLFEDGKGNDTLFAMLGDPDVKVRILATEKSIDDERAYFSDRGKAARLLALVKAEQNEAVARDLTHYVTRLDVDALGMSSDVLALAKSPMTDVRKGLSSIIAENQGQTAVAVLRLLLNDADHEVQRSAISALSTGGITPGVEPVCKLLSEQIVRTDELAGDALWSGSASKCDGMDKRVIDELQKRVADSAKVTNAVGIGYSLAASSVCRRTKSPDLKKLGFAIGKALVSPAIKDPNTRHAALDALVTCDSAGAVALARSLTADKDKGVAEGAKKIIAKR